QSSFVDLPISVIIPVRNEAQNLPRCLESLHGAGEIIVIDSQSSDETCEVARRRFAQVVQFHYHGGWPKKRQWAIDNLPLKFDWVLLLDADEALTTQLKQEIRAAISCPEINGYWIKLQMHFLGRRLRHCGATFSKLSLFRHGKGHFECRIADQDSSMCDIEVHEHVMVDGQTARLQSAIVHNNVSSLSRYLEKHNEYSNWEARVWTETADNAGSLPPALFGTQAQRRRWLRKHFFMLPGSPLFLFLYRYLFRFGFLDGKPGLFYCALQAIQLFQVKAKIYELRLRQAAPARVEPC
ncbi:MAG: glycosyltransferase family 2 protein, partial [Acidobacteria bacterium]